MFYVRNAKGEVVAIASRKIDALSFIKSDPTLFVEDKKTR